MHETIIKGRGRKYLAGMEQIKLRNQMGVFEACRAAPSGDHDIKKGDESAMFKYRSRYCDIQTSRHFID